MTCNPPPPSSHPLVVDCWRFHGVTVAWHATTMGLLAPNWSTTSRPFWGAGTPPCACCQWETRRGGRFRWPTRLALTHEYKQQAAGVRLSLAGRMKRRGTGAGQIIPRSERLASWAILKRVRLQAQLARCLYGRVVFQLSNFTRKETTKAATLDIQLALSALNFLI